MNDINKKETLINFETGMYLLNFEVNNILDNSSKLCDKETCDNIKKKYLDEFNNGDFVVKYDIDSEQYIKAKESFDLFFYNKETDMLNIAKQKYNFKIVFHLYGCNVKKPFIVNFNKFCIFDNFGNFGNNNNNSEYPQIILPVTCERGIFATQQDHCLINTPIESIIEDNTNINYEPMINPVINPINDIIYEKKQKKIVWNDVQFSDFNSDNINFIINTNIYSTDPRDVPNIADDNDFYKQLKNYEFLPLKNSGVGDVVGFYE